MAQKNPLRTGQIWSGFWSTFDEAPKSRPENHTSARWIARSLARLEAVNSPSDLSKPLDLFSSNPLVALAPILFSLKDHREVHVLDVGGNLGQLYFWLRDWLGVEGLVWSVLEREEFLKDPRILPELDRGIDFVSRVSALETSPTVVHFGSSLQYFEQIPDDLRELIKTQALWVSIADFMGSESIESFVTHQKYGDDILLSKFRNLAEVKSELKTLGFELSYQAGSLNESNLHYYPEMGLPAEAQIDYPMDLIFRRSTARSDSRANPAP